MRSPQPLRPLALSALLLVTVACQSTTKEAAPAQPTPVVASPFAGEVGMGIAYLQTKAEELVTAAEDLMQSIEAQNLAAAQDAYYDARAPYEEIEVVARAFPELHHAIDARAYEFEAGEMSDEFGGFHRIEIYLFAREKTEPAIPFARRLVEDVEDLQAALTDRGRFDAATSFDAMIDRCTEISAKTITGEEEPWSDQSLMVIRHGWMGVHSQYRHFASKVRAENVQLAERIDRTYRQALELIAQDFPLGQTAGAPYSLVNRSKRRDIADASIKFALYLIQAEQELGLE